MAKAKVHLDSIFEPFENDKNRFEEEEELDFDAPRYDELEEDET